MAKATVSTAVEIVKTEVQEEVIQLTLSRLEARTLIALTNYVYGPSSSYNREISAIRGAVQRAGSFGYVAPGAYFSQGFDGDLNAVAHKLADK